jgi:hypothetical protein
MHVYESLIDALNDLNKRGYTTDFKLNFNSVECSKTGLNLSPDHFEIAEHYRFEADTNPDDSSILYAIQSIDGCIKGFLVNAYGVYSEASSDNLIQKLRIHE